MSLTASSLIVHRLHGVGPVLRLLELALQGPHGQGRLLGQAHVDAAAAAGAVVGGDLDAVGVLPVHAPGRDRLKARGLGGLLGAVQQNGPDGGVGAHQGALVALDALGGVPGRDLHGGAPLLVLGGARGPGAVLQAVLHHGGHRQPSPSWRFITATTSWIKAGAVLGLGLVLGVQPALRDVHLLELVDAMVDGGAVHVHHRLALLLVIGLVDGVLHLRHRLVDGDHAGEGEEGGLQDGVGAAAQPQLPGDADGVDGVEPGVLFRQRPLHGGGQVLSPAPPRPRGSSAGRCRPPSGCSPCRTCGRRRGCGRPQSPPR